jgi:hypothetical protein
MCPVRDLSYLVDVSFRLVLFVIGFAFEVWNLVCEEKGQHLIESMPRRLCAVVNANGKRIDY